MANDILWGWQEIAEFVGVSIKKARGLEKAGMPVRQPGGPRTMVEAHPAQLLVWLKTSARRT